MQAICKDIWNDIYFIEVEKMELAEIRNTLEKMAATLADFRGSL